MPKGKEICFVYLASATTKIHLIWGLRHQSSWQALEITETGFTFDTIHEHYKLCISIGHAYQPHLALPVLLPVHAEAQ